MPLQISVRTTKGRPAPGRALEAEVKFRWHGGIRALLLDLDGRVTYNGRVLSDTLAVQRIVWTDHVSLLEGEREYTGVLVFPLSAEAIRFIEDTRKQADVAVMPEIAVKYQEVRVEVQKLQDSVFHAGRVFWQDANVEMPPIPRSEWLKRLEEMQWSELELFEMPVAPLLADANLTEALRLLREAQDALRMSDHKGVLARCREAFESAAKFQAQGDTKEGFDLLLRRAFPEHEAKRNASDGVIHALSEYAHTLGRHAQYPALHVSRAEAEFAFAATISLFSLLSRRLAKSEVT
jgi:hypothetical protein